MGKKRQPNQFMYYAQSTALSHARTVSLPRNRPKARAPTRAVHGVRTPNLLTLPLEVCVLAVEDQTETGSKRAMGRRKEGLGEDIRHLRGCGDVSKPNHTVLNEFSNEVPPYSNVLGASVRTWVPCKSYCTLVVAPQGSGFLEGYTQLVEESPEPHRFTSSFRHRHILSLNCRRGYRSLSAGRPHDCRAAEH